LSAYEDKVNRYNYSFCQSLINGKNKEDKRVFDPQIKLDIFFQKFPLLKKNQSNLLIIDQFEELLTAERFDYEFKKDFLKQLTQVYAGNKLWILFIIREDSLPDLEKYKYFMPNHATNRYRLELLDLYGACQVIDSTTREINEKIDPDALALILKDLQEASTDETLKGNVDKYQIISPFFLQILCHQLWEKRKSKKGLNLNDIEIFIKKSNLKKERPGKLTHIALERFYSTLVKQVSKNKDEEYKLRRWLQNNLIKNDKHRIPVIKTDNIGIANKKLKWLEKGHLLVSNASRYELAHDKLIDVIVSNNTRWYGTNLDDMQMRILQFQKNKKLTISGNILKSEIQQLKDQMSQDGLDDEQTTYLRECEALNEKQLKRKEEKKRKAFVLQGFLIFSVIIALIFALLSSYGKKLQREKN
jgi:hypothetical protein